MSPMAYTNDCNCYKPWIWQQSLLASILHHDPRHYCEALGLGHPPDRITIQQTHDCHSYKPFIWIPLPP